MKKKEEEKRKKARHDTVKTATQTCLSSVQARDYKGDREGISHIQPIP